MQRHHAARRGCRLAQGDVRNGAVPAEDAHSPPPPPRVDGDAVDNVGPRGDLEHVGSEPIGAVARDDYRGLGLVFGARGTAAWAAGGGGCASAGAGGGGGGCICFVGGLVVVFVVG